MKTIKQNLAWILLYYLRFWAKVAISLHKPVIIGIAGSIGKSSTRNAVATILARSYATGVIETNSETGLPLGILGLKPYDYSPLDWLSMMLRAPLGIFHIRGAKYLVIEMGIDDPLPPKNMEYLLTIVIPQIGIITYESAAHTLQFAKAVGDAYGGNFKKRSEAIVDAIAKEDLKLLATGSCRLGIVNADSAALMKAVHEARAHLPMLYTFGSNPEDTVRAIGYDVSVKGTVFRFSVEGHRVITLSFPRFSFPEEYRGTFAAGLLTAKLLGIPLEDARTALEMHYSPPPGRASIFEGIRGSTILDSSYNASKPTNLAFLRLLRKLKEDTKRPAIAILADMLELGPEEQTEHEDVAREIPGSADYVYLVGNLTKKFILPKLRSSSQLHVEWFETANELNDVLIRSLPRDAIVLVKGSQGKLWLEETIKLLLKNKAEVSLLCRQNVFWQKVKKKAGRWIEVTDAGRQSLK